MQYRHGVDDKRRVMIPAKWRSKPESEFTILLWPHAGKPEACLLVLPPAEMDALTDRLKGMSYSDPVASALRRALGPNASDVTLDKGGRMLLPEVMARKVGIEKEAMLVGMVDRFEIWNPERYEAANAADAVLLSDAYKLI